MKKVPKYEIVKQYIKERVNNGEYLPGDRIPGENEISEILGVSSITIKKAMTELVDEGIICRIKGKGSFVNDVKVESAAPSRKLIAFLLSCQNVNDSSCMKIMMGIQRCISMSGYSLIVEYPGENPENELQIIKKLMDSQVAAFIIFSANPEKSLSNYIYLKKNNIPFVLLDRWIENFPTNSVACNNHDGAFSAVDYLISLKHKKIGFVAEKFYLSSEKERFKGYSDALLFNKLNISDSLFFTEENVDYDRMTAAIKSREITALFAVNDRRGLELINKLQDRGVRIPEDVSIIGFDDYENSRLARIPLSTVRQHFEEEGFHAAQLVLNSIAGPEIEYSKILVGTRLIIRSSTAAPGVDQ